MVYTKNRKFFLEPKSPHGVGSSGVHFSGGVPVGFAIEEERFYDRQYDAASRSQLVLQRNDKKQGTLNDKYLDYVQSQKVHYFTRKLEERGYSFGEFMDWLAMQAVIRPSAGQSAASIANYAMQSFFIDVHMQGQGDGLFNRLVALSIQLLYEFVVDCVAKEVMKGSPEQVVRKGFDSVAGKNNKKPLNKAFYEAMDDHLDALETAIEAAVKNKQGPFKDMTSAANHAYYSAARFIATKASKLSKIEKERLTEDPVAAFDFYNEQLAKAHIPLILKSEWVEKIREERAELMEARQEIEELKATAASGTKSSLGGTRAAATKQQNMAI